jgi:hypothetical protein
VRKNPHLQAKINPVRRKLVIRKAIKPQNNNISIKLKADYLFVPTKPMWVGVFVRKTLINERLPKVIKVKQPTWKKLI